VAAVIGCIPQILPNAVAAPATTCREVAGLAAGEEFDDCTRGAWCLCMVIIPNGTFLMGSHGPGHVTPDRGRRA
jgi:hypothetical protein